MVSYGDELNVDRCAIVRINYVCPYILVVHVVGLDGLSACIHYEIDFILDWNCILIQSLGKTAFLSYPFSKGGIAV